MRTECFLGQLVLVLLIGSLFLAVFNELFGFRPRIGVAHDEKVSNRVQLHTLRSIRNPNATWLADIESKLISSIGGIGSRWSIHSKPKFLELMDIPLSSWSIQKLKFLTLLLTGSETESPNGSFVVGFSGSSVTAGHDNYLSEAFPAVFESVVSPVFKAIGVPIDVRNRAIGNNPCFPYAACVATHLGQDLDILFWEQSMNCGRDSKPVDTFTRSATHMAKMPTVVYLLSGGPSWKPEDCANFSAIASSTTPSQSAFRDIDIKLVDGFVGSRSIMSSMEFLHDREGAEGQERYLPARFSAVAPMAQSTFPIADYRCSEPYSANFSRKSTGPQQGALWHPGTLGHQLRGDSLAFFFLTILRDALHTLRAVLSSGETVCSVSSLSENNTCSDQLLTQSLQTIASQLNLSLPVLRVVSMRQLARQIHRDMIHQCSASTQANYPVSVTTVAVALIDTLFLVIRSAPVPAVPDSYNLPETLTPPSCITDFEPRQLNSESISHYIQRNVTGGYGWTKVLSPFDAPAVEKAERLGRGYLDRKYIWLSQGAGSTLRVNITVRGSLPSPIWICELQKGFGKYPPHMADLHEGTNVSVILGGGDDRELATDLLHIADQCYRTKIKIPSGQHALVLKQAGHRLVNVAYVLTF